MADIRKVELNGNEQSVADISGSFVSVKNNSTAELFISKKPGFDTEASEGVMTLMAGECAVFPDCEGVLYLNGTGTVQLVGSDIEQNFFKPAPAAGAVRDDEARAAITTHIANSDVHRAPDGITITVNDDGRVQAHYSNRNLLINPDFKINQRNASGTITGAGYFVDRWKLISGTVTINDDRTLLLNGTISQTLEESVGGTVTASASSGSVSFDSQTNTFSITASEEIIAWAKLEEGNAATPFLAPQRSTELAKCQRYCLNCASAMQYPSTTVRTDFVLCPIPIPQSMHHLPEISSGTFELCSRGVSNIEAASAAVMAAAPNGLLLKINAEGHDMASPAVSFASEVIFEAEI